MSGPRRRIAAPRVAVLLAAACLLTALAGCRGHTTGASDITRQPDGTYSAKLNAVGSCEKGSPTTPCTGYTRWRKVGTSAWTNGPTVSVPRTISNAHHSQTAAGLAANTQYEYQVCGKEFDIDDVTCVGPDQTDTNSTAVFTTGGASPGKGKAGGEKPAPASQPGTQAAAPQPPSRPAAAASDTDDGSSPLVPIAVGVGAAVLVLGGTWLAARRFSW